jgi:hypothetical protein
MGGEIRSHNNRIGSSKRINDLWKEMRREKSWPESVRDHLFFGG